MKKVKASNGKTMHGLCETKEYRAWKNMKGRCEYPYFPYYNLYGGRGIKVCARWEKSFANFYADMGKAPSKTHSLDRIDNDLGYKPGNCRWATKREQSLNTRRAIIVSINGKAMPLIEWCEKKGILYVTAMARIRRGWSPIRAVTQIVIRTRDYSK